MSRVELSNSKEPSTTNGIHEIHKLNAVWDQKTTNWKSIYISSLLAYVTAAQFSLYFSSLWPYLQILDHHVTEKFLGTTVAAYSCGQIIGSPVFGYISNRMKNIRVPLYACLSLSLIGNFLYVCAQLLPHDRKYAILISAIGLLRSYVATASTKNDRSRAIAFMTGGFALGMTSGPILQFFFVPLGYPGFRIVNELLVNVYTAPACCGIFMNTFGILLTRFCFVETYAGIINKIEVQENGELRKVKIAKYDRVAVGVCYATRFTQMFTYTNLETLGAPLSMTIFAFNKMEVVRYLAITHACLSAIAFCVYMSFVVFNINFRRHVIVALFGLIVFHLVSFSWPFLSGHLKTYTNKDLKNTTHEPLGCNVDRFSWCDEIKPLNVWVYFVSFAVFIGLCFPNINITVGTLFSNILGPRFQGTQQGIMQMSGSFARLTGPIIISSLYSTYGPRHAWILEIVVLAATIGLWLIFYKRMIPLEVDEEQPPPLPSAAYVHNLMGNLLTVIVQFEFYFIDGDARKHYRVKAKVRRRTRLTEVLTAICKESPEFQKLEGSWRTESFSCSPSIVVNAVERIQRAGTVVIYLERNKAADEKKKTGIEISPFTASLTFDVQLNQVSIARYPIRVPMNSTVLSALNAFVRAHSCCSSDFEITKITTSNEKLVSGCDRVNSGSIYIVELSSKGTLELNDEDFVVSYKFVQNDEEQELQLECKPGSTVAQLKERLNFLKIDSVYYTDEDVGALVMLDDLTQLVPDAHYWIDVIDTAAENSLKEPQTERVVKCTVKPEIMAPAGVSQSVILRRNAGGVQLSLGSLFDANTNKFVSVHFPLSVLKSNLSRRSFGKAHLKTEIPSAKSWTLVNPNGEMDENVDAFGVKIDDDWDQNRLFYFLYECRTGTLTMDLPSNFYENIDLGDCTHALNSAVMGVYFVFVLYFKPALVKFDRAVVLEDLIQQLMSPMPSTERPPLSDRLREFEQNEGVEIRIYVPDILEMKTPNSIEECRELVDDFKVPEFKEVQLEHWFLPLHQLVSMERLTSANIVPYDSVTQSNLIPSSL
ncbi:hypothetical protein M3Y98_01063500 [Aphelenchoides besseyi]|nr:hypothetical protein M3Y98_01063500 [Aphelenchoides besseyi]